MGQVDARMLFAGRPKSIIPDYSLFDRLCLFASSYMFAFSRNVERAVAQLTVEKKYGHEGVQFIQLKQFYFELKCTLNK